MFTSERLQKSKNRYIESKKKPTHVSFMYYAKVVLLHIAMGYFIFLFRSTSVIFLHGILVYWIFVIINKDNKNNEALLASAYIAGAEVFFRMTGGVLFYETGKYAVIIFLLIGMLYKGSSVKTVSFWVYILILIPGIVVASFGLDYTFEFRKMVAFNLSGPICLGICAIYCYYKKIPRIDFEKILLMVLLPLIANMTYLFLFKESLGNALINMSANYAATGGYGPNQVSTILGLGAFILITRLLVIRHFYINLLDLILLGGMSYRAMVTFSRGGVVTAIVCSIAFLLIIYFKENSAGRKKLQFKFLLLSVALFFIWTYTTIQTGGLIVNRYTNKDAAGRLKDDITTGRTELIETELAGFYHNPLIGVGVGRAKELRVEEVGMEIASHNELSRLLSEHGLLGLFALLILIFVPIVFWTKFKNNYYFLAFLAFWFLTINHSAMRIALPAFVYGLALLYIVDEKKDPVYRKRLST